VKKTGEVKKEAGYGLVQRNDLMRIFSTVAAGRLNVKREE
jgi:hypothetical protein